MPSGGCYCGAIRYEADGDAKHETNCHCETCRRCSGAPFVAWATFPKLQFRFVAGAPARFRSSPAGTRCFCAACGTPLTFELDSLPEEVDVTLCSLDDPEAIAPRDHTFTRSRLAWLEASAELPEFPERRE